MEIELKNVDNKITELLNKIKSFFFNTDESSSLIKPNVFNAFGNFTINSYDESLFRELQNVKGIYLFEIMVDSREFNFNKFSKNWELDKVTKSPLFYMERAKHHALIENPQWIPFYIGKSEKIGYRLNEHIVGPKNITTSALKLKDRKSVEKLDFRVSIIKLDFINYDIIAPKVESWLREELNPIIGKQ